MRTLIFAAVVATALPSGGVAQSTDLSRAGPRITLDFAEEVALARSAAPADVSADATIMVWNGSRYVVGVEGTSGVACYVSRSWPESLEPHCFDEEGARTILPIHMFQVQRMHEGAAADVIEAEVARGVANGDFHYPSRPAMSYMMSASQALISDDGRPVGSWMPHLMIYYPGLTSEALGLGGEPSLDAAVVTDSGEPSSSVMIVVRDFVAVKEEGTSPNR